MPDLLAFRHVKNNTDKCTRMTLKVPPICSNLLYLIEWKLKAPHQRTKLKVTLSIKIKITHQKPKLPEVQRNQNFSRNRRSLSGTITEGEKKIPFANQPEHIHNREKERTEKRKQNYGLNKLLAHSFIFLCTFIAAGAPLPKCMSCAHTETRYRRKKTTRMRCGAGRGKGGFRRRRTLCEVSLGYDRLVPTLAGLLTVAKRRPKTTKRDFHSNALRQGQLFGAWGSGASSGREGGQRRETIEPRLAACDWNPELTFAFLGIN